MKVVVSCATTFHSDHMAYQLQKRGVLLRYVTAHPFPARRESINPHAIKRISFVYALIWVCSKLPVCLRRMLPALSWITAVWFDKRASRFVKDGTFLISWAWTSLRSIRAIHRAGGIAVVEECGSFNKYQDELLSQEYTRLGIAFTQRTHPRILEREERECREADFILCPSEYVALSLTHFGIERKKIVIIPYGVDPQTFDKQERTDSTFRIIFVGTIGVRKGLIYLLRALESLSLADIECLVIGAVEPCFKPIFERYKKYVRHIPRVAHAQLQKYYSNSSCFVFPTIDEGMAYVLLEAMACGLPVITTTHSGAEGIIRDGVEGFIVPIRDSESIRSKITYFYENPDTCAAMGRAAFERSKEYTWDAYGQRLTGALEEMQSKMRGKT